MIIKLQYINQEEREQLIREHSDKYLVQEDNITEGNFLYFDTIKPLDFAIQEIQDAVDILLLKQEGII